MINTCLATTQSYHSIAYYSHLIPVFILIVIGIITLVKTKYSLLSKILFGFLLSLSLWLIGDVIVWTQTNYNLVVTNWAPLDYINVVFSLFAAYFFAVFIKGSDIKMWQKIGLFILSLPGAYLTIIGATIPSFSQPWCEAANSEFLVRYKLIIEALTILFVIIFGILTYRKSKVEKKRQIAIVSSALALFFVVFSITEYMASQTGIYEINLYSLFVLPIFILMIMYAIINLQMFQVRQMGTQLLTYVLLIMIGSQFFFLEETTDKLLTLVTFVLSVFFTFMLNRITRREVKQREQLQVLSLELVESNEKLKSLDKLKTEFLSLASHQLRSPLTAIKGYSSMLDEGSFGELNEKQDGAVKRIYASAQGLVNLVEDLLNVSKIEQGGMKFEFMPTDIHQVVMDLAGEMKISAENKKLELRINVSEHDKFMANADPVKIKQVFLNLVDNSIKYTPSGFVEIGLKRDEKDNIVFYVKDSGVGVTPEMKTKLFQKFSRADSAKQNTGGSGLGLYLAQQIAKAHKGEIIIDSEGVNKGATFSVIIPAVGFKTDKGYNLPT